MLSFLRAASKMTETHNDEPEQPQPRKKLQLMKSPVVEAEEKHAGEPNFSQFGDRYKDDAPEFQRHEEANMLEVFFDLFFAANYTVFSKTQNVTDANRIAAYVGYFSVLWFTWLSVGLYDVRFVTDSIFERAARAVHLGVMVGFAVVAPNFKPEDQHQGTFQTMSLILMVSRLCLSVEYASILWHVRRFKSVRVAFYAQIAVHFIAAMIYLGISFRFEHRQSSVFVTWYIVSALEAMLTFGLGLYFSVLSFTKTHLMSRMSLLTIIILGDGIVVMAEKVVTIVKSPEAWNPLVIGIVTAAAATTYFVFLIYFDWMKTRHLPALRQQIWTIIHFPFHLAMVLFMQGFTQFILWSKIIDVLRNLRGNWITNDVDALSHATSEIVQKNISTEIAKFFTDYRPKYTPLANTVDDALNNITAIPDSFWPQLVKYASTEADSDLPPKNTTDFFVDIINTLGISMENSLFSTFDIDLTQEFIDSDSAKNVTDDSLGTSFETKINDQTWERYQLVFFYGYIASGVCLAIMTLLTIVSRTTPWKAWPIIRTIINVLLALGVALVALLVGNADLLGSYLSSPWLLPTICLVWLVVLILTHAHSGPPLLFKRNASFLIRRKTENGNC